MEEMHLINELLNEETHYSLPSIMNRLHKYYSETIIPSQVVTTDLLDEEFIEEIKNISEKTVVSFGKTLSDIKCVLKDDEGIREHEIYLKYKGCHKFTVSDVKLPYSPIQDREYSSIEDVVNEFQIYIRKLAAYFKELENIDHQCTVVEPIQPSFKEDYRKILLDDRTWLHVEVTLEGSARNIHLSRQSEDKLCSVLLAWNYDKNIVENVNCISDLVNVATNATCITNIEKDKQNEVPSCSICFCADLADCPGLPQPLCQNTNCDVYFHRSCLFQWLVACEGGRLSAFGLASGSCPTCLQPITCSERDN